MILDTLANIGEYAALLPHLDEALACLEQIKGSAPGRYEYESGFVLIQEGETTPIRQGDFEAHRKYLDVQILLDGAETIAWAELSSLRCTEAYDADRDRGMYAGDGMLVDIHPGEFYVCFPHDGHKACGHREAAARFRKAVVKLPAEG